MKSSVRQLYKTYLSWSAEEGRSPCLHLPKGHLELEEGCIILGESALRSMICSTIGNSFMDITCHSRPIDLLPWDFNNFVDAEVTT